MEFRPQRVDQTSWRHWLKEGVALSSRRAALFVILTMATGSLHFLPRPLGFIFMAIVPLVLGLGTVIAYCADTSKPIVVFFGRKPLVVWVRIVIVGSVPWLLFVALSAIASWLIGSGEPPVFDGRAGGSIFAEASMSVMAAMFIWFATLGWWIWFMVPLIVIAELPILESIDQVEEALTLNRFAYKVIAVAAVSTLLGEINPVLVFPWFAIITSVMYVSFRQIWWGRRDNLPKSAAKENARVLSRRKVAYKSHRQRTPEPRGRCARAAVYRTPGGIDFRQPV